ncbi:hypothetical protein [Pelomonas cellulosilytica]|uniref:Uncharacterized protein n=1 Tax=Pelomonas cellulosilytica TaxID=2906762 RepID=A0ABS8XUW5_9BURK|nr:hypothetical protein [Pelomonas sp. P8]MCE4555470.1 hypothetical protein [Pelomonas sp. P8]
MQATNVRSKAALLWAALATAAQAAPSPEAQRLATDRAAVQQLVGAVSLDVMTEASVDACEDIGAPSAPVAQAAWVTWRERHQLAPMRSVLDSSKRRQGGDALSWGRLIEPMRQRVLGEANPEPICAGLARDLQTPAMDATALYPQAGPVARALVAVEMAQKPDLPTVVPGQPRGAVVLPSQVSALAKASQRAGEVVVVKGWVKRWGSAGDKFELVHRAEGGRRRPGAILLDFDAEPWVGREIVLRGKTSSLGGSTMSLNEAALVADASALTPSPLPQAPPEREEVLLQRVTTAPAKGLADKDLAAIVIHGWSNFNNGTTWEEDVRFLLRDGSVYRRTEMPPDQLNVAVSRQLEPQQWGRWRAAGNGYEMQPQDDDGRPGAWQVEKHYAVKPWPADTKLEGSFSRGSFHGSLVLGGMSFRNGMRFTRDGRFERSSSSLGTSGSMAATLNGTMISGSSQADGSGSSSTGGGVVGGPLGTAGAVSSRKVDDGASRRGRYRLSGYVLTLDFDDGHQERLLSFPVHGDADTVYVGSGSLSRDK